MLPLNGVMWVGTLPEYRGLGFAQNLMRLADERARETGAVVEALTTGMPQFYRPLGWGVCGQADIRPDLEPEPPASLRRNHRRVEAASGTSVRGGRSNSTT